MSEISAYEVLKVAKCEKFAGCHTREHRKFLFEIEKLKCYSLGSEIDAWMEWRDSTSEFIKGKNED